MHLLAAIVGSALVLLAFLDIVTTVLHPEEQSILSSRFQRSLWFMLRLMERLRPRQGDTSIILNWGLPLMVAGLIALWLLLLLLGFGLIYYPWIGASSHFSSSSPLEGSLFNALYYSGVTVATLGYGDIQPVSPPFRALAVGQALLGAVTISAAVAYVLSVYPALAARRTLATALDAEVAGHATGLPLLRRYLQPEAMREDELADRLRELSMDLLNMTRSHENHPVLYYAHPRRVQYSFLRVLVTTQNLIALVRYGLSPDQYRSLVYHPHTLLLEQSFHHSLRHLSGSLHMMTVAPIETGGQRKHLASIYDEMCTQLEQLGLVSSRAEASTPVSVLAEAGGGTAETVREVGGANTTLKQQQSDAAFDLALDVASESALEAFIAFRCETDSYIAAYAATSGYDVNSVRNAVEGSW
jgi:hypothetical protein